MLPACAIVIMGISGCGKTTLGKGLAEATGYRFIEGDDLHPAENIAKMSSGIALTDEDRWPWLDRVAEALNMVTETDGCIVSCSALRYTYRHFLRTRSSGRLLFVFPQISSDLAWARLNARPDHYMPSSLVDSQFQTLELPKPDENVLTIDGAATPERCIDMVMVYLSSPLLALPTAPPPSTNEGPVQWHAKT